MTRTWSRRPRLAAAAVATALLSSSIVAATASQAQAACTDIDVAFARGTGEMPGLGIVGGPFVSSLTSALTGYSVSSYAVDYAADVLQTSAGPGSADMVKHVTAVAADCPGTRFVLSGYSQGATLTSNAVGSAPGGTVLPDSLSSRVAAVVAFGNPLRLTGGALTQNPVYGSRAIDLCNAADPVCGGGANVLDHLTYAPTLTTQAAQAAAGLIKAGTAPVEPAPVDPAPVDPAPAPGDPAPVDPAPAPVDPAPVDPAPTTPAPATADGFTAILTELFRSNPFLSSLLGFPATPTAPAPTAPTPTDPTTPATPTDPATPATPTVPTTPTATTDPGVPTTTNPFERGPAPTEASLTAASGPFATASVEVPRSAVSGFGGATITYPTATDVGTFGAVAIAPGFTNAKDRVAWYGPRLASHGFVVITIDTLGLYDQPAARGDQLRAALSYLTQSSAVRDRVDPNRLGVMGYSMGGGGSLEATKDDTALKASVPLAPWNTDTSWPEITTPTLIIGGQNDTVAPPDQHAIPFYQSLPGTTPKAYLELAGASHSAPTSSNAVIASYSIAWLKRFIDDDQRYAGYLCAVPNNRAISQYLPSCSG